MSVKTARRPFQILFDKDISFISIVKGLPNDSKTNCSVEDPEDQGLGQESVANGEPAEEKPAAGEETIARHVVEEITLFQLISTAGALVAITI